MNGWLPSLLLGLNLGASDTPVYHGPLWAIAGAVSPVGQDLAGAIRPVGHSLAGATQPIGWAVAGNVGPD